MAANPEREREIFSFFCKSCAEYEREHPGSILFCPSDQNHPNYKTWRDLFVPYFDSLYNHDTYSLDSFKQRIQSKIESWTYKLLREAPEWVSSQTQAVKFAAQTIAWVLESNNDYRLHDLIPCGYASRERTEKFAWLPDDLALICWESHQKNLVFLLEKTSRPRENGLLMCLKFIREIEAVRARDMEGARRVIRALLESDMRKGKTTDGYLKKLDYLIQKPAQELHSKPEYENMLREEFARHSQACKDKRAADLIAARTSKREERMKAKQQADERARRLIEMGVELRKLNPRRDWRAWTERTATALELIEAGTTYLNFKGADRNLVRAVRAMDLSAYRCKLGEVEEMRKQEAEREKVRQAIEAREREKAQAQRLQALEVMRQNLVQRCRQIVTVFNGIYDLEIDSEAVLNGYLENGYAAIRSTTCTVAMAQNLSMAMQMHSISENRTWLEIGEDEDSDEMQATFDSANVLVWHELCHLAATDTLELKTVDLPDRKPETLAQAREIVIDALAMRMGHRLYAHPAVGQSLPLTDAERLRTMRHSLTVLARRVVRHLSGKELETEQHLFVARLMGQLAVHADDGSRLARNAYDTLLQKFPTTAEKYAQHREAFATLYGYVFSTVDVATVKFLPQLAEDDEDAFATFAPTLH